VFKLVHWSFLVDSERVAMADEKVKILSYDKAAPESLLTDALTMVAPVVMTGLNSLVSQQQQQHYGQQSDDPRTAHLKEPPLGMQSVLDFVAAQVSRSMTDKINTATRQEVAPVETRVTAAEQKVAALEARMRRIEASKLWWSLCGLQCFCVKAPTPTDV